eukprot:COSAG01_NODE_37449_length_503_cov_1.146040_1_plen_50_part_01
MSKISQGWCRSRGDPRRWSRSGVCSHFEVETPLLPVAALVDVGHLVLVSS